MKLKILLVLLPTLAMGLNLSAQGTVRGEVTDGTSGEVLLGATVRLVQGGAVKGGAYTDLEGAYTIKAQPGVYSLIISYISYINDTISNIQVEDGKVLFYESLLVPESAAREDLAVEITAKRNQASEVNLYNQKRNSINAMDGISFDVVRRTGDANVAAAMQRVSGVSVEGGKYVYVRGLGDRYSKTMLNGADLPGLDPNRNTVQMDIFPSNLIDNVMVFKTFTPDLPGDFTGGLVNVTTKDFPDRPTLNVAASMGYNPQANLLNDEFLTYQTGGTDWLGFDDGTRAVPNYISENGIPRFQPSTPEEVTVLDQASKSFETGMAPNFGNSFLNQRYQISFGNQYSLGGRPIGFIVGLSYRNAYTAYTNGFEALYTLSDSNATALGREQALNTTYGEREVLWGGLVKVSYKPAENHKVSFNYMRNQNGRSYVDYREGPFPKEDPALSLQWREMGYVQRSMDAFQLQGDHVFGKLKFDWIGSYVISNQEEPDLRFFANDYQVDNSGTEPDTIYDIQANAYREPQRFYRDLNETNIDVRLNFELPFKNWNQQDGKIKFGGAYTRKDRDFRESRYIYNQGIVGTTPYDGDPEKFFADDNLGVVGTFNTPNGPLPIWGVYLQDVSERRNQYSAEQNIFAGYAMIELPLALRWNLVAGARFERTDLQSVSIDPNLPPGELDLNDILPAATLIYKITERMNFRAGYSRTLARPTFREIAPFVSFDIKFGGTQGNPALRRTLIDNVDLRWEYFPTPTELVSVSAFFKNFDDPIERVRVTEAQNPIVTFKNQDQAELYGIEFEFKKDFSFINEKLRNLFIGGNFAYIYSEIDIDPAELEQIRAVDPERPARRPMFGQSPYTANAEFGYVDREDLGLQASLSFSIFGPRISLVGVPEPDVYEQPRGLLNFFISKNIGEYLVVSFRARNLLNPRYRFVHNFKDQEFVFSDSDRGRIFTLGVSLTI